MIVTNVPLEPQAFEPLGWLRTWALAKSKETTLVAMRPT